MTLRVTIEVVPFGMEDEKRTVDIIDIWNIQQTPEQLDSYEFTSTEFGKQGYVFKHQRQKGAHELIRRVLNELLEGT